MIAPRALRNFVLGAALNALSVPVIHAEVDPRIDDMILSGVDQLYQMRFDEAEATFRRARMIDPLHPYAYLGFAAVDWVRYIYESEQTDQALLKPFAISLEESIRRSEAWIAAHPRDAEAYMTLGAAHGLEARLLVVRGKWFKAYLAGRTSMRAVHKAVELDPDLIDVKLGLGMYDYYSDAYTKLVAVLAKLVLGGDRKRGIETLKLVAEKGRFCKYAAKLVLVEIYNFDKFGDRDPKKAVGIMAEVRKKYPESAMLHSAEVVSLYDDERYAEARAGAEAFLHRVAEGKYRPIDKAKGYVILGSTLWVLGRKEEAYKAFREASKADREGRLTRWAVWASIRAGHAADLLGRRQEALASYRLAYEQPDHWGYRKAAKEFLKRPCTELEEPLDIIPPNT